MSKNTAWLIILRYDNFGEIQASPQRNGMAAISKIQVLNHGHEPDVKLLMFWITPSTWIKITPTFAII